MADGAAAWEALDKELVSMVDLFANMVKASRMPDDESDQTVNMREGRKERAPGELLEVWAEKLVQAGHNALLHVGALKAAASFSDFEVLMGRVRKIRQALAAEELSVAGSLSGVRLEAGGLLALLEASYYATPHRGRPVPGDVSAELRELAAVSLELADKPEALRGAGAGGVGSTGGAKP